MQLKAVEEIKCGQLLTIENGSQLRLSKLLDSSIGVASRDIANGSSVKYVANQDTDDITIHAQLILENYGRIKST